MKNYFDETRRWTWFANHDMWKGEEADELGFDHLKEKLGKGKQPDFLTLMLDGYDHVMHSYTLHSENFRKKMERTDEMI